MMTNVQQFAEWAPTPPRRPKEPSQYAEGVGVFVPVTDWPPQIRGALTFALTTPQIPTKATSPSPLGRLSNCPSLAKRGIHLFAYFFVWLRQSPGKCFRPAPTRGDANAGALSACVPTVGIYAKCSALSSKGDPTSTYTCSSATRLNPPNVPHEHAELNTAIETKNVNILFEAHLPPPGLRALLQPPGPSLVHLSVLLMVVTGFHTSYSS